MENKVLFLKFIQQHNTGTISTANLQGLPNAATVDFSVTDDLRLIFNVSRESVKFKNVLVNPNVCAVFSDFQHVTVQFFGLAKEMNEEEINKFKPVFETAVAKRVWKTDRYQFMIAKPTYLRYCNFTNHPPKILELYFN